jgi:hypothetical protein
VGAWLGQGCATWSGWLAARSQVGVISWLKRWRGCTGAHGSVAREVTPGSVGLWLAGPGDGPTGLSL